MGQLTEYHKCGGDPMSDKTKIAANPSGSRRPSYGPWTLRLGAKAGGLVLFVRGLDLALGWCLEAFGLGSWHMCYALCVMFYVLYLMQYWKCVYFLGFKHSLLRTICCVLCTACCALSEMCVFPCFKAPSGAMCYVFCTTCYAL